MINWEKIQIYIIKANFHKIKGAYGDKQDQHCHRTDRNLGTEIPSYFIIGEMKCKFISSSKPTPVNSAAVEYGHQESMHHCMSDGDEHMQL